MVTLSGGVVPALAQLVNPVPSCTTEQNYKFTIGNPLETTFYTGNVTFRAGDYHVRGDLYFSNGTITIQSGARFHIDGVSSGMPYQVPVVSGYSLIIGANVTVQATGATFNANCSDSMWKGFAFAANQSAQTLNLTNCYVGNAQYGVNVSSDCNDAHYFFDNCRFEQDLYGVVDLSYHYTNAQANLPICTIKDCQFYSQPNLLPPYGADNGHESWMMEAMRLSPTGNHDGSPKVLLQGTNSVTGSVYGLVANMPGQGLIFQDGGALNFARVLKVSLWLDVLKEDIHLPVQVNIGMNTGTIAVRTYESRWTAPAEQMYGLVAANNTGAVTDFSLSVNGIAGDTTLYRCQTGVLLDEIHEPLNKMSLTGLTYGLSLRAGSGLLSDNTFNGCLHGVRIRPNTGPYTANFDISCNSFIAAGYSSTAGIYIDQDATLNDQGSLTYPVGNRFQGYGGGARSIVNDGNNSQLNYYRYSNSTDEEIATIKNQLGNLRGNVLSTTSPSYGLTNYCQNIRGSVNGVQMRGASQATHMQALMDTLRRQAAPASRLGRYQAAIREWLLQAQPDTAALDAYVRTLPTTNPTAFFGLGLDLLEQYRRTGRNALALSLRPVLAGRAVTNPAASARLALSDVLSRLSALRVLPSPGRRWASVADSATLRRLARTPGGIAETAALWFNYLYPGAGVQPAVLRSGAGGSTPVPASRVAFVTLYPNPATDQLRVEATAPAGQVTLRVVDMLSGKPVLQFKLPGYEQGLRQADVSVRTLPAGQYAATLLVDGAPLTTQKLIINR